jgi:ADP-ribose pyrophosphatase YjhB (NUDIX family)
MSKRIDYYDDPNAPAANSMVPSVNVLIENEAGEILMIRRSDNGNWAIPGGAIDLGESLIQAAKRETLEETGIECEINGVIGIYTDPKHIVLYTSNGEARQEFSIVVTGRATGGEPTSSNESTEVVWVPTAKLDGLQMHRSMRERIDRYLSGNSTPHID